MGTAVNLWYIKQMSKKFLITRAERQSTELVSILSQHDIDCVVLPCVEISPPTSRDSLFEAIEHIDDYDCCIFTSVNAVEALPHDLTGFKKVIAIGPATAKALQQLGIEASVPEEFNSEGLLAMPELMHVDRQQIAIFTGENPRGLLHETLQQRNAHVELIFCYKRSCPHYKKAALDEVMATDIDGIICSSAEILVNLIMLFEEDLTWLTRHSLVVVSDNMHQLATKVGFQEIHQAKDATTQAILASI